MKVLSFSLIMLIVLPAIGNENPRHPINEAELQTLIGFFLMKHLDSSTIGPNIDLKPKREKVSIKSGVHLIVAENNESLYSLECKTKNKKRIGFKFTITNSAKDKIVEPNSLSDFFNEKRLTQYMIFWDHPDKPNEIEVIVMKHRVLNF